MQSSLPAGTRSGDVLFRWRSYLPIALGVVLLPALKHHHDNFNGPALHYTFEFVCLLVSLVGLGIRIGTVGFVPRGTSGRNTRGQVATRLNTTGLYSLTRNPLYLGNYFMMLGVVMFTQSVTAMVIFTLAFWLYYERIIAAEERFLAREFGEEYARFTEEVPAFVPRLSGWVAPDMEFSVRTVLRREYSSAFALIASLFAMEFFGDLFSEHVVEIDPIWTGILALGAVVYLSLRTMKKRTTLLDVEGR